MIAFNDVFAALKSGARRFRLLILASLMLMPVLIAAPFTSVQKDAVTHLDRIHAAIVNLDEPIVLQGQLTPVGRLLAANLIGDKTKRNITWSLSNTASARRGLADGTFAVVLWIPPTFSRDATSWADVQHPENAVRGMLNVQTSPSSGVADPIIGSYIAQAAVTAMNQFLTGQFLTNVFLGFNKAHNQLITAVDGANKLATGAKQLTDGLGLASNGADRLSDGLHQISDGANQLDEGSGLLANGAGRLADGMGQLSDGLNLMSNKTDGVPQNVAALAQGSKLLADGLKDGAKRAHQYYDVYVPQLDTIQSTYATYQAPISAALTGASSGLNQINGVYNTYCGNPVTYAANKTLCDTLTALKPLQPLTGDLTRLNNTINTYSNAIGQGLSDARALRDGLDAAAAGSAKIAAGNAELAAGIAQLKDGIDRAADGGNQLKVGADQLKAGADQLHDGAHRLAVGAKMASDGSDQLAAGLKLLKAGAEQIAAGNKRLADGLADGLKQIPTFTPDQIAKLSDIIAAPVSSNIDIYQLGAALGTAYFSALALAIAALVMFMVLRATPLRSLTSSDNSVLLALQAYRPAAVIGIVQAVLMTSVIGYMLHLTFTQALKYMLIASIAALSYASISQGLVALFGGRGRFLGLAILTLCAPVLVISTVPGFLQWVVQVTPIGPAANGIRAVLTQTDGLVPAILVLIIWYFIGLGMTVFAISRQRSIPTSRFIKRATAVTA